MNKNPAQSCNTYFLTGPRAVVKYLAVLLTCLDLILFLIPASAAGDATVFIYHKFGEDRYPTTNVDTPRFREQMAYLKDNDYRVIPLADLVACLRNGGPVPGKTVVLTIDDGYQSVYTHAWPILKSFGYPFTVFLNVGAVDRDYRSFMTWSQVKELQEAGVDFEDHSYAHPRFGSPPAGMGEGAYRQWIRADLTKSAGILTRRLGRRPRFLALPYGEYNRIVIEEAKALKYDALLTQDPGAVSGRTSLDSIPREPILGNEWSTMDHFKTVLARVDLPFTQMAPGIDPLIGSTPSRFGVRLLYPDRYMPGSLAIYVSELGWRKGVLDGDLLYINNSTSLKRRINRVAVRGLVKNGGRPAIRFWLLIKGRPLDP